MARNNIKQDLIVATNIGIPKNPLILPVALDQFATKLSGVSYHDYSTKTQVMVDVWNRVIQHYDLDWAGIFVDDLFEFETLGIERTNQSNAPFAVKKYLSPDYSTANNMRLPDPEKDGRMPVHLEAIERIRDFWENRILISGSVASPFTALTILYGIEQVMVMLYDDPVFLKTNMKFLIELAITWGKALIKSGADIIWLGDCSASSRFLSCELYDEFAYEPAKYVIDELKKCGGYILYHCAENRIDNLSIMSCLKPHILTVASGLSIEIVKKEVCKDICVMGNLDPVKLLYNGTLNEIEKQVGEMVKTALKYGGHIVGTDEGIPSLTPEENLVAFIRSIRHSWL